MEDHEWQLAARRSELPIALHFLVCPHSPYGGALLNNAGEPELTDYSKVDWKGLARAARAAIEQDVPKNMGLFIGNDAVDVMDVLHVSTDTGMAFRNEPTFEYRVKSTLSQLSMTDMRAGLTMVSHVTPGLHINTPMDGKRPPLGSLILSLKFMRATQVIDYLTDATVTLFGAPAMVATFEGFKPVPTVGKMPTFLTEWLNSQFGVEYGDDCTVFAIERTFSV
ncbi:hypothetical protein [Pseudomonas sp. UMAB-40]|uniref:hypothetical protein n=1 Tax=Pseudomonas sp. UMAB-40 TaxID=1365407 RepID=UPI001C588368|nr:hypothetical protein [Pseudomonas sp. UMAB-40]